MKVILIKNNDTGVYIIVNRVLNRSVNIEPNKKLVISWNRDRQQRCQALCQAVDWENKIFLLYCVLNYITGSCILLRSQRLRLVARHAVGL